MDMERKKAYMYDAFGELIYLVAMVDGLIQDEEVKALEEILKNHPWSKEIQWSFNYEASKNNNPEDTYKKVIMACHDYGPNPEFEFMVEVMEAVATASAGVDDQEQAKMDKFVQDLSNRFKADIEKMYSE